MTCDLCDGTGWWVYQFPIPEEGENGTDVDVCPACVMDGLCPACGEKMVDMGAVQVCARCGFVFDEAAAPVVSGAGRLLTGVTTEPE